MPLCKPVLTNTYFRRFCNVMAVSKAENFKRTSNIENANQSNVITKEMRKFVNLEPELLDVLPYIPSKYLRVNTLAEHHYLISPTIARTIADKILPFLDLSGKQLIAETNAGLGLITRELLERGVKFVRMYEYCSEFQMELKDFGKVYPNRVELFKKDLFLLSRYAYMDKHDTLNRVGNLFENATKRSWTDEPFITIIGAMNNLYFLSYIVKAVALQIPPMVFGRIQILAFMKAKHYAVLASTPNDSTRVYNKLAILCQLLFDIELLDTVPKKMFLPWMGSNEVYYHKRYKKYDLDSRYFVRINFKKNLPLEAEQLMHFIFFLKQLYSFGNRKIIPTVEKWLPDAGRHIICPTLKQDDFPANVNIFTQYRELTPSQILALFREMANHPFYKDCSFREMVQNELINAETIQTDMVDVEFQSKFIEDFKEKINLDD